MHPNPVALRTLKCCQTQKKKGMGQNSRIKRRWGKEKVKGAMQREAKMPREWEEEG